MMTYAEFELIKRIKKHPDMDESYYIRKRHCSDVFEKAKSNGYVSYKRTGYKEIDSQYVLGFLPTYSKVWIVTKEGISAFDEYAERRRELWSNRRFSIICSIIAALISFIAGRLVS